MIKVVINNINVPVSPDISIKLNFVNPLFSEKRINEAFSFGFSVPETPILNNIYKNSNRVNSNGRKRSAEIKIYHSGVLFISGVVYIEKQGTLSYSLFINNEGMDIHQQMSNQSISENELDVIELWSEADDQDPGFPAGGKKQLWVDHMEAENNKSPEVGKAKFPMIKAWYDDPSQTPNEIQTDGNNYLFFEGGIINGYLRGDWLQNPNIVKGTLTNDKNWSTTYSPCIRIEYLIEKLSENYGLIIEKNELVQIQEFLRLCFFSGFVKDEYADLGASTTNVHGRKYDLSRFLPDVSTWDAFDFLKETFNAVFVVSEGNLTILLAKDMINSEAIDFTRYAQPKYSIKDEEALNYQFQYDIDEKLRKSINISVINTGNKNSWQFKDIVNNAFVVEEVPFKHLPLNNYYSMGFRIFIDHTELGNQSFTGEFQYLPIMYRRAGQDEDTKDSGLMIVSDEFPEENERVKRFEPILFHGKKDSSYYVFDPNNGNFDPNDPQATDVYFACNLEDTSRFNTTDPNFPHHAFSTKHIFLSEEDSTQTKGLFENYHRSYYDFINGARKVSKTLNLPAHVIKEMSKFKNIKHSIDSPRGKFEGVLESFSVELRMNDISPTDVNYLIQKYEE